MADRVRKHFSLFDGKICKLYSFVGSMEILGVYSPLLLLLSFRMKQVQHPGLLVNFVRGCQAVSGWKRSSSFDALSDTRISLPFGSCNIVSQVEQKSYETNQMLDSFDSSDFQVIKKLLYSSPDTMDRFICLPRNICASVTQT